MNYQSGDELFLCNFLSRLHALQRLCSDNDPMYPSSLLFIPGPDGRYNKGSLNILKYLFEGATGKYLFDGAMDENMESLEDMILLIQQSSVSVFWSSNTKRAIGHILSKCPILLEYSPTNEEESDVDKFQEKKCESFKKMMLDAVETGRGVGMPIPIGYDDLNEIETWPLIQSFALESVLGSTGFFSASYLVVDITEYLDIMFKGVDGFMVDNAIFTIKKSVIPHVSQFLAILDTVTPDQRSRLTIEDITGPLDMLFDFGELECAIPADPTKRPYVLFGESTTSLGSQCSMDGTEHLLTSATFHGIVEGSEPSTGIRWCRTLFLQNGRSIPFLPFEDDHSSVEESVSEKTVVIMDRAKRLYYSLVVGLRAITAFAFSHFGDVLEAGRFIQSNLDSFMKDHKFEELADTSYFQILQQESFRESLCCLKHGEWLQLHVDCMNGVGEVIGIDDVDDMGGSCLMYLRASVHGFVFPSGEQGVIAVGDTFVFSVNSGFLPWCPEDEFRSSCCLAPFCSDSFCLTHCLPYYRAYIGPNSEEKCCNRMISCLKNPHILPTLGLGKPVDLTPLSSDTISLPIITSHWLLPFSLSNQIRLFSEGFVIEKMETLSIPLLFSFNIHIEEHWVVSASEAISQALEISSFRENDKLPDFYSPDGNLVVFKLKSSFSPLNDDIHREFNTSLLYNPLSTILPTSAKSECQFLAFFVPTSSRFSSAFHRASAGWRSVISALDIPSHKANSDCPLPMSICCSFLMILDNWSMNLEEGFRNTVLDEKHSFSSDQIIEVAGVNGSPRYCKSLCPIPGLGFLSLRCVHSLSESLRMNPGQKFSSSSSAIKNLPENESFKKDLICVSGLSGCGAYGIGQQISSRLQEYLKNSRKLIKIYHHVIDFAQVDMSNNPINSDDIAINHVRKSIGNLKFDCDSIIVMSLVLSPVNHILFSSMIDSLRAFTQPSSTLLVSVSSPKSLFASSFSDELWKSIGMEINHSGFSHLNICIEDSASAKDSIEFKNWMIQNNPDVFSVRLSPSTLRMDEEILDEIKKRLTSISSFCWTGFPSVCSTRGYLSSSSSDKYICDESSLNALCRHPSNSSKLYGLPWYPIKHITVRGLTTITSSPDFQTNWNLQNVLNLSRFLFPNAVLSIPGFRETWNVPPGKKHCDPWHHLLLLAQVKAVSGFHQDLEQRKLNGKLESMIRTSQGDVDCLRQQMLSIHAVLPLSRGKILKMGDATMNLPDSEPLYEGCSDSSSGVYIEANNGFLICRVIQKAFSLEEIACGGFVCFTGRFSTSSHVLLEDLIPFLKLSKYPNKKCMIFDDLTRSQLSYIQEKFSDVPLEGDIWFDGTSFVDIHGNRRDYRPDIRDLAQRYLDQKNKEIDKYNAWINEVQQYL